MRVLTPLPAKDRNGRRARFVRAVSGSRLASRARTAPQCLRWWLAVVFLVASGSPSALPAHAKEGFFSRSDNGNDGVVRLLGADGLSIGTPQPTPTMHTDATAVEPAYKYYSLPAEDADASLERFAEQSGAQIVFLTEQVRGTTTQAVVGRFTAREALERMIAGTALTISEDEKTGAFVVKREAAAAVGAPASAPLEQPRPGKRRGALAAVAAWFALTLAPMPTTLAADASAAVPANPPVATGAIVGRVFNPVSQEYVRDAEVRLEGTSRVTYTESDGSFRFDNVALGSAAITVNYIGYNSVKETFAVAAGQPAVREINLTSTAAISHKEGEIIKLDTYVVSSEREGNAKAIMDQRRNMNITTSVSSEIFGNVADNNVGEFLKYLPGVDLDYVESEARGPRLGGMDGQYVGVSFDGNRIASADYNRGGGTTSRATSFEGFSITSVESIEIYRTTSPEFDADMPAGLINMKTKRAFDRKGRTFEYAVGANFNDEQFTLKQTPGPGDRNDYKWKGNYQLSYSDTFFGQRLGILVSASRANSFTEQFIVANGYNASPTATDTRPLVIRQIDFKDGPKFVLKDALMLTADWKAAPGLVLSLNVIYSKYDSQYWNRNFTWVAANDNNTSATTGRSSVGGDGILTVIAPPRTATANVATVNNGGQTAEKLIYSRQFAPRFEYKIGSWVIDGGLAFSYSVNNYDAVERGFSWTEAGGVASGWTATRPSAGSWEWVMRQNSGADWFDLHSFTNTDSRSGGTRVENADRTWATEKWTGTLNAQWTLPFLERFPTDLKFGSKWDEETRKNNNHTDMNMWSYIGPGGNTTTVNPTTGANQNVTFGNWANVGPQYISPYPFELGTTNGLTVYNINGVQGMLPRPSRNAMADLFHAHPELFVNTATPENYFTDYVNNARDFRQTITAGYVQADTKLMSKLSILYGVRLEETKNVLTEFDQRTRAEVLAAGYAMNPPATANGRALTIPGLQYQFMSKPKVKRTSRSHDYFPSIVAKYEILSNLEFQAGFNRAISRPAIDNLTGLWTVNETAQTVNAPNPDLQPEKHKVYQTRLSYYFGGRSPGQLSLALAQDEATNFISSQNYSASEFGVDDPTYVNYTFISFTNNATVQRYRNMDLNYNQTLGFLPSKYLQGINLGVTYSRSYANQRRNNIAPHRVAARLGYAYGRFNGSLGAIWRDESPNGNYGQFWGEYTKYDLALTFRLTRNATLFVQGRNISNVPDLWYQSPPGVQEGEQPYLRQMESYGANWVFGVQGEF